MTDSLPDDRRTAGRQPFSDRVMVVHGERAWFAEVLDLSEGGCGIAPPPGCGLDVEQVVRLFFYSGLDTPATVVAARIARVTDDRIGIEYQDLQAIPPGR
ncbi:PilZ domain-containing protein [Lysobacter sp. SG-8]|uniref:PilZ domain-containing protein n=1 Tax=Marilutibacter penaei TaxID=2759900 RepID=A0A7W3U5B5_9GAMM|nr:PilZ domain-containing protein [Lysobacter penaei]MBB1089241.1 PilZ domain-containing protein [Lysobacter penaei]